MPRVGFEPKIPVFERAKTVHVLDRKATVIGWKNQDTRLNYTELGNVCIELQFLNVRLLLCNCLTGKGNRLMT
jgi:hypothetical protein